MRACLLPIWQQFYERVGEKLEGYVNAIEKGHKGRARSEAFELITILFHAKDFVRAKSTVTANGGYRRSENLNNFHYEKVKFKTYS